MSRFRDAVGEFRHAVHSAGEQYECPGLEGVLEQERIAKRVRLRWAAAAAVVLVLAAIPPYRHAQEQQRAAAQAQADAMLLERVNDGLSRSVPRAMAPLLKWAPVEMAGARANP